jgi:6-phosphofructokinase 1
LEGAATERDASGNLKLGDIGFFLRDRIKEYFKQRDIPAVLRYIDPSYLVRSSPANAEDSILCDRFARHAVHAAMAGKTGLVIGYLHNRFIHLPIELLRGRKKQVDPEGVAWSAVLATTGQPARFE